MMVEQMVNSKYSKYGLGNSTSIFGSSSDKQLQPPPIAIKNAAMIDMRNEKQNVTSNLVYARRKSEAEVNNPRPSEKNETADSQQISNDKALITSQQQANTKERKNEGASFFATSRDLINHLENRQPLLFTSVHCTNDTRVKGDEQWKARYIQLQMYLKQCDNSYQEAYVKKIESLTEEQCGKHAVELERRAILLMLEEGKEIQRMKDFNIIGQVPAANCSLSPQSLTLKPQTNISRSHK